MKAAIEFKALGKGYHEHRSALWLLRVEPVARPSSGRNLYYGLVRPRGSRSPLKYGPFDTARSAKLHIAGLIGKRVML